jgi:hypothetical protein
MSQPLLARGFAKLLADQAGVPTAVHVSGN